MVHNIMPGTEEHLLKEQTAAYVGIDPTADSLHIGHLVSIMMLKHFQACGHKPIALVGGATGMIGDPSMKSAERNLLDEETLRHNQNAIRAQLGKFLDFDSDSSNAAVLVNNYDWMKEYTFLHFIRDIGKHITVNYMMSKDSVKKRITGDEKEGMSFTEFTYQLVQGYDYLYLFQHLGCKLQMGGSDQWGNITTGTELIRRKESGEAFALTCPLITKADGGKFGKTEQGNVWLDAKYTSPYKFYQFWLNSDDAGVVDYAKVYTLLGVDEINAMAEQVANNPGARQAQRTLAREVTAIVHGAEKTASVEKVTAVLFGGGSVADLTDEEVQILAGEIPTAARGVNLVQAVVDAGFAKSNGEARRLIEAGAVAVNGQKATADIELIERSLVRKGKNSFLLVA